MNLATLISLAITYGPTIIHYGEIYGPVVVRLVQAMAPALQQILNDLSASGLTIPHVDKVNRILDHLGHPPMASEDADEAHQRWMDHASAQLAA